MQPTDVQVERSLAALQAAPGSGRSPRPAVPAEARDLVLLELPDGLLQDLGEGPPVRPERLEQALDRLAAGRAPTDGELAARIVGRLVCDRLAFQV